MARCTICAHPQCDAINASHQSGAPNRRIATQFSVPESTLRRHFAKHPTEKGNVPSRATSPDRLPARKRQQGQRILPDVRPATQSAFLAAFCELANESGACDAVQIDRSAVRYWEEHDPDFSLRYEDARARVNDAIRDEIHRRAVRGYTETLMNAKGDTVEVTKYSDRLLEFWAKARMSEFREKSQLDVTSNGQTVGQGITLEQLAALAHQAPGDVTTWKAGHGYDHEDDLSAS